MDFESQRSDWPDMRLDERKGDHVFKRVTNLFEGGGGMMIEVQVQVAEIIEVAVAEEARDIMFLPSLALPQASTRFLIFLATFPSNFRLRPEEAAVRDSTGWA